MNNYIQPGEVVTVAAPSGGVVSGAVTVVGGLIGIAAFTAAEGAPVEIARKGVFELPKVGSQAWSVGDRIYWDPGNARCSKTATATFVPLGWAVVAAGSGAGVVLGTVLVLPNPLPALAAAIADLGGTLTGTIDGDLADVGATNSGDVSGAININFKEIQAKVNAILAALRSLAIAAA